MSSIGIQFGKLVRKWHIPSHEWECADQEYVINYLSGIQNIHKNKAITQ